MAVDSTMTGAYLSYPGMASPISAVLAAAFQERVEALVALGVSLHRVGQPAHRLERVLDLTAQRLGLTLHAFSQPNGLLMSFEDERGRHTRLIRSQPGGIDLERLARLTWIADDMIAGRLDAADSKVLIDQVMKAPRRWKGLSTVAAYVFSAAAFSVFFHGGMTEMLVSVWEGLAVGCLAVAMRRVRSSSRLFELSAATAAAVIACTADSLLGAFEDWVPLASGLIILLPGISLVDSVGELAHGYLSSGAARMAGVGVAFLALTFGTVLGQEIASHLPDHHPAVLSEMALPEWTVFPALFVVAAGSMIRFACRPQDFWTCLAGSAVALFGARFGVQLAGPIGGPFLAALFLGLVSNFYARYRHQALELVAIPGIALLVPGSVGVQSLGALVSKDPTGGVDTAFRMFLIAMALVAGLLFSNSLVRDRTDCVQPAAS